MADKTFFKVKIGLLEPKHYEKMGKSVWLYLRIIHLADWETGVIPDWKDADIAEQAVLAVSTVRNMRQQLDEEGYIKCASNGRGLRIEVTNWNDPAEKWTKPSSDKHKVIGGNTTPTYSQEVRIKDSAPKPPEIKYVPVEEEFEVKTRKTKDPRNAHPAVKQYRTHMHLNVHRDWLDDVVRIVGDSPDALVKWGALLKDWNGNNWNPGNVKGMLEAFQKGGVTRPGPVKQPSYMQNEERARAK